MSWYLTGLSVAIADVDGRPQLVQAAAELRSYLWLYFALSLQLTTFRAPTRRICEDRGNPFFGTPHRRICDACKRRRERGKKAAVPQEKCRYVLPVHYIIMESFENLNIQYLAFVHGSYPYI